MPIIEPLDQNLKNLQGIHLWHADMSSCSQRVRIALAEKNLSFKSHLINIYLRENASEAYQRIHPKGVVPALVNDGELIIESIDIIDYLEKLPSGVDLHPDNDAAADEMTDLMKLADDSQIHLKLLTFEFLFRAAPPAPTDLLEKFFQSHKNESLKQFYRDFLAGFPRSRIETSVAVTEKGFRTLDKALSEGQKWLVGDNFSLADIAWMPNMHRFKLIGWPFQRYHHLADWFERVSARPSYRTGLLKWESREFAKMVTPALSSRQKMGDGIETYGILAD